MPAACPLPSCCKTSSSSVECGAAERLNGLGGPIAFEEAGILNPQAGGCCAGVHVSACRLRAAIVRHSRTPALQLTAELHAQRQKPCIPGLAVVEQVCHPCCAPLACSAVAQQAVTASPADRAEAQTVQPAWLLHKGCTCLLMHVCCSHRTPGVCCHVPVTPHMMPQQEQTVQPCYS